MQYLPRFHPMIANYGGRRGWWIIDSCAQYNAHERPIPYVDEPCEKACEAKEICDMLNATEPDPRMDRDGSFKGEC